jgi:hypothetical protein
VAIGPAGVASIFTLAEEVGFRDLPLVYESPCTDQEGISVAIRTGDVVRAVYADGAFLAMERGDASMARLVRLWLAIHRWAFDKPEWVRLWLLKENFAG